MRILIIGGGKTVYFLARQFQRRDYHITIINRDLTESKELAHHSKATVVHGDGSSAKTLEQAGARQADIIMALTPHDHDNLVACQVASKLFGVPRTMALVTDPENEEVFQKLGITVVFSSTRIIASLIEQQAYFEDIDTLMPIAAGRITVADIHLDNDSPVIGKALAEIELTEGSLVACILRDDAVIVPRGGTTLLVDDHLILISQPENHQQDLQVLCGVIH